jgi:uncharacterized protein (TIGR04255 family)
MNIEPSDVYPNAPVRRVALEVKSPEGPGTRLLAAPVQRMLRDKLGGDWVIESIRQPRFVVGMGPAGPMQEPIRMEVWPCFLIRDRTIGLTVNNASVTLETTKYSTYPAFRELVARVLTAVAEVLRPEGIARVGLRYIDELREVPGIEKEDPQTWRTLVDRDLLSVHLGDMDAEGYRPIAWMGAVQYTIGPNRQMQFQFGPRPGPVSYPDGPMRRPSVPDPGPWFLMDFDAGWEPQDIPEFDVETILANCDELRKPIKKLFDLVTTEALRRHYQGETDNG